MSAKIFWGRGNGLSFLVTAWAIVLLAGAMSCGGGGEDSSPAPNVVTLDATQIETDGAVLNGSVNPNGFATDAWFEYGKDPDLISYFETALQKMGSGTAYQSIASNRIPAPWDTYYFRTVASNAEGLRKGEIKTFTTGNYYVAFGDSITKGTGDNISGDDTSDDLRNTGGGFEPILNNHLTDAKGFNHTVVNEGVGGETAEEGLLRLPSVRGKHPDAKYYLVLFGTNDAYILNQTLSGRGLQKGQLGYAGSYKDWMQQIIDQIYYSGKIPYLAKIPKTLDPDYSDALIQEYNDVIDELVASNPFIVVIPPDLYYGLAHPDDFDADKLHPNGFGYQEIALLWRNSLVTP